MATLFTVHNSFGTIFHIAQFLTGGSDGFLNNVRRKFAGIKSPLLKYARATLSLQVALKGHCHAHTCYDFSLKFMVPNGNFFACVVDSHDSSEKLFLTESGLPATL